jgi:hypothetical protein
MKARTLLFLAFIGLSIAVIKAYPQQGPEGPPAPPSPTPLSPPPQPPGPPAQVVDDDQGEDEDPVGPDEVGDVIGGDLEPTNPEPLLILPPGPPPPPVEPPGTKGTCYKNTHAVTMPMVHSITMPMVYTITIAIGVTMRTITVFVAHVTF